MRHSIGIGGILFLAFLSVSCALSRVERTLLYDTRESPWTIYYVRDYKVSPGTSYYYQVRFKQRPFAIPKGLFNSAADINTFLAASGPETQASHNDAVLLVLSYNVASPSGSVSYGGKRTVMVQAVDPGTSHQVRISDLEGHLLGTIELPAVSSPPLAARGG